MPRTARVKGNSGTYHIILRGTNRQEIFHDDQDNERFIETLRKYKQACEFQLYAWCLMGNHAHFVMKEGNEELAKTMKRIAVSYASYYNWKYAATGHLFQDRFWSENIDSDKYLLTVVKYIHNNPVKAEIVTDPSHWRWSSCNEYYCKSQAEFDLLDEQFVLEMFSKDNSLTANMFKEFNESAKDEEKCNSASVRNKLTDDVARRKIMVALGTHQISDIKGLQKKERDFIISKIKKNDTVSLRQIARILGVSLTLVHRA